MSSSILLSTYTKRQIAQEPSSAKRELLNSSPLANLQQISAITELLQPRNSFSYAGPNKQIVLPRDVEFNQNMQHDWYFLVGNLVPTTSGPGISSNYAFVWVITNTAVMGPELFTSDENLCRTGNNIIENMFTVTDMTATYRSPTIVFGANDPSIVLPSQYDKFTLAVTKDYMMTSNNLLGSSSTCDFFPMTVHAASSTSIITGTKNTSSTPIGIDLQLVNNKPVMYQGTNGVLGGGVLGIGSNYFSYTNIGASGTITIGSQVVPVQGVCWMDRQSVTQGTVWNCFLRGLVGIETLFSNTATAGWNWFAIQLNDAQNNNGGGGGGGTQLTFSYLTSYDAGGNVKLLQTRSDAFGTWYPAGAATNESEFMSKGIVVTILDYTTSPDTNIRYPCKWRVQVDSKKLDVIMTPIRVILLCKQNGTLISLDLLCRLTV